MNFPGDDRRSAYSRGPEIIAAEQRVLVLADGLLTWMRHVDVGDHAWTDRLAAFFTHQSRRNPGGEVIGTTEQLVLEKMDPDANRLLVELLRAAWELRCWQTHYGEITARERDV